MVDMREILNNHRDIISPLNHVQVRNSRVNIIELIDGRAKITRCSDHLLDTMRHMSNEYLITGTNRTWICIGSSDIYRMQNLITQCGLIGLSRSLIIRFINSMVNDIYRTMNNIYMAGSGASIDKKLRRAYRYNKKGITLIKQYVERNQKISCMSSLIRDDRLANSSSGHYIIACQLTDFFPVDISESCGVLRDIDKGLDRLRVKVENDLYNTFLRDTLISIKQYSVRTLTINILSDVCNGYFERNAELEKNLLLFTDTDRFKTKR